jgi:hypothetical protein
MTPEESQFAYSSLDDDRKLIAAGKAQRWEVLKWAVALNVGLATAATAINKKPAAGMILGFALIVLLLAAMLVLYYTKRMTGARNDALAIYRFLKTNNVDCAAISGKDTTSKRTWKHDAGELTIFLLVLVCSCIPAAIIYFQFD